MRLLRPISVKMTFPPLSAWRATLGYYSSGFTCSILTTCFNQNNTTTHRYFHDSRRNELFQKIKENTIVLRENVKTIPNLISISRILVSPFVGYCILADYSRTALSLFAYCGLTDWLDGFIARRYHMTSKLGSILDPISDKFLATIMTGSLLYKGILSWHLAIVILGRDAFLVLGGLYYRYESFSPSQRTFSNFFDLTNPMAEIRPSFLSKFNTMLQLGLFFVLVGNPVWHLDTMLLQSLFNVDWAILDDLNVLEGGQFIVGGFTLATGIDYALTSRKVYRSHRQ